MKRRNTIIFYSWYYDLIKKMPEERQLGFIRKILDYGFYDELSDDLSEEEEILFEAISTTLDTTNANYESKTTINEITRIRKSKTQSENKKNKNKSEKKFL